MASNSGLPAAASLVDVAVRAAVLSGAPRRTVAATAAAVASVVMVELRGGAGDSGAAKAPPSASRRRRIKRKKKAEREKLATLSQPARTEEVVDHGRESGGAAADGPASLPVAPVFSQSTGHPPLLVPIAEDMSPNTCQYCRQAFPSRNKLFDHLKESGHSKFFAPRSAGDSTSVSGLSAGSLELSSPGFADQSAAAVAASTGNESSLVDGGSAGSAFAGPRARNNQGGTSTPPRNAKPRDGKGRVHRP
mmetsp:Transcript_111866/g.197371  ORF Transcript_111866/g.197371 Transcript_111866/m.197371 type:complete len:249 (-) Transcript_111866:69-815(-)